VGPLVSLILGLGFGAVALVASSAGLEGLTLGVVRWLSVVNVVLAMFQPGSGRSTGRRADPARAAVAPPR
jgi:hypothetical protein